MAVHSAQLVRIFDKAAPRSTIYTVPSGVRTIVKNVHVAVRGTANRDIYVGYDVGGVVSRWWTALAVPFNSQLEIQTWFVLNAGEKLTGETSGDKTDWIVSGTELLL